MKKAPAWPPCSGTDWEFRIVNFHDLQFLSPPDDLLLCKYWN